MFCLKDADGDVLATDTVAPVVEAVDPILANAKCLLAGIDGAASLDDGASGSVASSGPSTLVSLWP